MTLAPEVDSKELTIVRGACPHDCPDACAMPATSSTANPSTSKAIQTTP